MSGFDALGSARGVLIVDGWTLVTLGHYPGQSFGPSCKRSFPASSLGAADICHVRRKGSGWRCPPQRGNWGVFEVIGRVALVAPFGFPETQAVSYALVLHFFEYLAVNVVGVIALMRYSLSLGQISAAAQKVAAPTEET